MEKYIYNEQNGLWYELQGDYYIPCLVLDKEDTQPIGMWGRKHDNDEIKADFNELYRQMNGMSLRDMDKVIYPVCKLCRDHEKAGFVEGIKVGIHLATEIE